MNKKERVIRKNSVETRDQKQVVSQSSFSGEEPFLHRSFPPSVDSFSQNVCSINATDVTVRGCLLILSLLSYYISTGVLRFRLEDLSVRQISSASLSLSRYVFDSLPFPLHSCSSKRVSVSSPLSSVCDSSRAEAETRTRNNQTPSTPVRNFSRERERETQGKNSQVTSLLSKLHVVLINDSLSCYYRFALVGQLSLSNQSYLLRLQVEGSFSCPSF